MPKEHVTVKLDTVNQIVICGHCSRCVGISVFLSLGYLTHWTTMLRYVAYVTWTAGSCIGLKMDQEVKVERALLSPTWTVHTSAHCTETSSGRLVLALSSPSTRTGTTQLTWVVDYSQPCISLMLFVCLSVCLSVARQHAMHAWARYCFTNSVCLSVCPMLYHNVWTYRHTFSTL